MKLLFLGDVMGRAGRAAVAAELPGLRARLGLDFVVVNGENASAGMGLTGEHAAGLLAADPDCADGLAGGCGSLPPRADRAPSIEPVSPAWVERAWARIREEVEAAVRIIADDVTFGIVSPDGREGMLQNAREFAEAGIPFIFDPGQAMPLFNGEELRHFIELTDYVTVNDYESNLLQERTGWSEADIVKRVKAYITTRGPHGSQIHTPEKTYDIPPAHERRVTDPTGCGDAFRAGLIYGIEKGYDWLTIGRMGNLMGALKVEHPGTQNQRFDFDEFNEQFKQQFGYAL